MTTCLGKSYSFGLLRVPFVNCCQFMYLVTSLLVLRAGCGIRLYKFLIIAYLFTLKKPVSTLILYIFLNHFIHVYCPGARADKPLGSKFWCQQKGLIIDYLLQILKNHFEVWLYIYFLMFSGMHIALGQEQTTPWWQGFDVNRKPRSVWPFVASFKMISLNSLLQV